MNGQHWNPPQPSPKRVNNKFQQIVNQFIGNNNSNETTNIIHNKNNLNNNKPSVLIQRLQRIQDIANSGMISHHLLLLKHLEIVRSTRIYLFYSIHHNNNNRSKYNNTPSLCNCDSIQVLHRNCLTYIWLWFSNSFPYDKLLL